MLMKSYVAVVLLIAFAVSAPDLSAQVNKAEVEQQAIKVLDEFMRSFNANEAQALAATYHFPHYRLARGVMSFWETQAAAVQAHRASFVALPATGWHMSRWISRKVQMVSENKVHVATRFRRLREDGSEIGTYDSLYILIRKDGRWGIKMRSSFL